MTFVYVYMCVRLGNQFFQYWVGKYIAYRLNRELKVFINDGLYIDTNIYNKIGVISYYDKIVTSETDHSEGTYYQDINNLKEVITYHSDKNIPIYINAVHEDYSLIKNHELWVKELYTRSPLQPLICNYSIVVHLRLGDCVNHNINVHNEYISFAKMIVNKYTLPVIIVAEEVDHYCTKTLYNELINNTNNNVVTIANNTIEEYQKDFDIISSAKVIVATNSTMSWWAAFLNPFDPDVYIGLSNRQPQPQRNYPLFIKKSPKDWKLWDMDNNTWIN